MTFPTTYDVRDVRISPNVVLAPMEGVTDLPFRRLIRSIGGAGLTYTEFVAARGLADGSRAMREMARFDPDERPVAVQIYGREPAVMAEAARMLEGNGATIIDINMGCPSKKVCAHSGGSALMKDPELATDLVRAVRRAIRVPLTVKMRSGFDASTRNAPDLAWRCQEEGAEAITIHWRTRADGYRGARAVDAIAATVSRLRIPVIGNGDIVDLPSARAMLTETGCHGLMIGRGAIRDPWLFRRIAAWLNGQPEPQVTARERKGFMVGYLDSMVAVRHSESGALGRIKMLANQFCLPLPHGTHFRTDIVCARSVFEVRDHIERYFAWLEGIEAGARAASGPWRDAA